jgi:hypothetical protein
MTDINDMSRAELEQQIAELQAKLAAMDAEPDSALRALIRFHETGGHEGDGSDAVIARAKDELAALRRGMELAPTPAEPGEISLAMIKAGARAVSESGMAADWTHAMAISRTVLRAAQSYQTGETP